MKRIILVFLVAVAICQSALAGDRWMAGLTGSVGLNEWAPRDAVGVEMSCFLLEAGSFRFGPGVGVSVAHPRIVFGGSKEYDGSTYLPAFCRMSFTPKSSGSLKPFVVLDAGYYFDLVSSRPKIRGSIDGPFISPQVGLNIGRTFYAALGVWCQSVVQSKEPTRYALHPSLSMKVGVRF